MSAPHPTRGVPRGVLIGGVLVFLALFALLLVGVLRSDRADRQALPSALIDKPAPAMDLPLLHAPERRLTLAELRGRPFLLNVWGSWCPECRVEHPVITRLAHSKRIRVIGYDLKDEPEDALRWLAQYGNPYSDVVADVEGRQALDWGIYGAPETFLVDAAGIVRWKHVGPLSDALVQQELLPAIERLEHR